MLHFLALDLIMVCYLINLVFDENVNRVRVFLHVYCVMCKKRQFTFDMITLKYVYPLS